MKWPYFWLVSGEYILIVLTDISLSERARLVHNTPGLSKLPLGQRLLRLLAGPFPRFLVLSVSFGPCRLLFPFFFSCLVCVRVLGSTAPRASPAPSRVSAGAGG